MRFYYLPDSYSGQIEGWAILGFRLGHTAFGLAAWPPGEGRKRRTWRIPHAVISPWAHTGQCDQRWVFRIQLGRRRFGCLTRGDATPDLLRHGDAGWHLA